MARSEQAKAVEDVRDLVDDLVKAIVRFGRREMAGRELLRVLELATAATLLEMYGESAALAKYHARKYGAKERIVAIEFLAKAGKK